MFTKMRATIVAEKRRADEAVQQLAEYRQQVEEERRQRHDERRMRMAEYHRQREEEHQLWMADARKRREEERRRAYEEWHTIMQQNAEMHQAMMAALTELRAAIARLGRENSGNARSGH